ncbi:MAG: hypothetical protein M1814_003089 [Vezdaea aestivalis]|nr:MAG: hypothetical protein M1814_003089 [Vezdaea aestivalis]
MPPASSNTYDLNGNMKTVPTREAIASQASESEDSDIIFAGRKRKIATPEKRLAEQPPKTLFSELHGPKKKLRQGLSPIVKGGQSSALEDDIFTCPPTRKKMSKMTWRCENLRRKAAGLPELPPLPSPPTALELDPTYFDDYESSSSEDKILPITTKDKDLAKQIESSGAEAERANHEDEVDDEYGGDFVDDTGEIIANGYFLPIQFSSYASQPFDLYVEDIIEYLTHVLLGTEAPRPVEVYKFAFSKITAEANVLADSEFQCANWEPDFVRALKAYPKLRLTNLRQREKDASSRCDACNQPRWVKYGLQFMGQPYKLEWGPEIMRALPVPDNRKFHDAEGVLLAPRTFKWRLGKTYEDYRSCKNNATTGHRLRHLPHELKGKIEAHLNDARHLRSPRPTSLSSTSEDMEKAASIYNRILAQGLVFQWAKWYKNVLEAARVFKNTRNATEETKEGDNGAGENDDSEDSG